MARKQRASDEPTTTAIRNLANTVEKLLVENQRLKNGGSHRNFDDRGWDSESRMIFNAGFYEGYRIASRKHGAADMFSGPEIEFIGSEARRVKGHMSIYRRKSGTVMKAGRGKAA